MEILYTDEQIVVCVKEPGTVSQDAGENSVPQLLKKQLDAAYIGVIHRLDREVGGVMVFALTPKAAAALSRAVTENRLEKVYHAVVNGVPETPSGCLEDLLYHDKGKNKTYVVKRHRKGVRNAKLEYEVLASSEKRAYLRIKLHTGRTHQIRVQFASRKHPLVGDGKYGGKQPGMPLMLWSQQLSFPHPVTGTQLSFEKEPVWKGVCSEWFT